MGSWDGHGGQMVSRDRSQRQETSASTAALGVFSDRKEETGRLPFTRETKSGPNNHQDYRTHLSL